MKTNEELLAEANNVDFKFTAHGNISRTHSQQELSLYIIKRAIERHGIEKYLYGKVSYTNAKTNITVVCPLHGDFDIKPNNLASGNGCPQCSNVKIPSTGEWIEKAQLVHGDKYDYSKVLYKNAREKVQIVCNQHGTFWQTPSNHINHFQGCPKCAGHNHNILYLLRCTDTGWYKIGITTDDVKKRIYSIGGNIEEVFHVKLEDPRHHEKLLHTKYKDINVYHDGVMDGNTEFFSLTE